MRLIILFVLLSFLASFGQQQDFRSIFVGKVDQVKLINYKNFWVKTGYREYFLTTKDTIDIYPGDSLFEFWVNYKKFGVGSSKSQVYILNK